MAVIRTSGSTKGPYATIAAAGTSQATATLINADMVMVTSGSGGIVLDGMNVGDEVVVCNGINGVGIDLLVYPKSGGSINNAAANTWILIAQNKAVRFKAIDGAGNVMAFF